MRRLNRYERKRQHKLERMKRHAVLYGKYDIQSDREYCRRDFEKYSGTKWSDGRNNGYTYWMDYTVSGRRKFAKSSTNRKIRSKYRAKFAKEPHEEIVADRCSDYEKEFDYWWTIW